MRDLATSAGVEHSEATKPEQIAGNVAAAGWKMTADDLAGIEAIVGR